MNATYETFDILRMARQVENKTKRQRAGRILAGAALVSVGIARGRWLGAVMAACGVHVSIKALTGRSPWEYMSRLQVSDVVGLLPGARRLRSSAPRDTVDEASWESFPASDPPAHTHGAL